MKNISAKYSNLEIAKKNEIYVPETIHITEKEILEGKYKTVVRSFISKFPRENGFIVRSAVSVEDSENKSFAGHFHSSDKVRFDDVVDEIQKVYEINKAKAKDYGAKGDVNLMVQPFIDGDFGGVAFSRWKYFEKHSLVEITSGGSKDAVAGINSKSYLISKDYGFDDVIPLGKKYADFNEKLKNVLHKLDGVFDESLDIEWVFTSDSKLYVLQIRPVTIAPYALKNMPLDIKNKYEKDMKEIGYGKWVYNDLSESLGLMSPLAFSLFEKLYEDCKDVLLDMYYSSKNSNFLYHLPNGCVLVNKNSYRNFFSDKGFFSSFKRTFYEKKFFDEMQDFSRVMDCDCDSFDYELLSSLFSYWQMCNVFYAIREKDGFVGKKTGFNEYDLFLNKFDSGKPKKNVPGSWAEGIRIFKDLFLHELGKLKKEISSKLLYPFYKFDELGYEIDENVLKERYDSLVKDSVFDYVISTGDVKSSCIVKASKEIVGNVIVIGNPYMFNGKIEKGSIIVSSFFKNDWISQMDNVAAVILEQGGSLSHSAIVARERNIPYFIGYKNATSKFKDSEKIRVFKNEIQMVKTKI